MTTVLEMIIIWRGYDDGTIKGHYDNDNNNKAIHPCTFIVVDHHLASLRLSLLSTPSFVLDYVQILKKILFILFL